MEHFTECFQLRVVLKCLSSQTLSWYLCVQEKTRVSDSLVLYITEGPCKDTRLSHNSHWITIGRTPRSNFQIKENTVSEQHAELCKVSAYE